MNDCQLYTILVMITQRTTAKSNQSSKPYTTFASSPSNDHTVYTAFFIILRFFTIFEYEGSLDATHACDL